LPAHSPELLCGVGIYVAPTFVSSLHRRELDFQRHINIRSNVARQPLSERIVAHGRKFGMQLGVGIKTDDDRRLAKLLQTPKVLWIGLQQ
jgi:hypothetical protein